MRGFAGNIIELIFPDEVVRVGKGIALESEGTVKALSAWRGAAAEETPNTKHQTSEKNTKHQTPTCAAECFRQCRLMFAVWNFFDV